MADAKTHFAQTAPSLLTLSQAAFANRMEAVKEHLGNGIDPDEDDDSGCTALHEAAKQGYWDIVRLLLEKGASVAKIDGNSMTPLHYAAKNGHISVAALLLECNAPINATNRTGNHPLDLAVIRGDLYMTQLLLQNEANASLKGAWGRIPLHKAAIDGNLELCEMLLEHDRKLPRTGFRWFTHTSPVLSKDMDKNTPVSLAFLKDHVQVVDLLLSSAQASPKCCDRHGNYLFLQAVKAGNCKMASVFLNHGAPIDLKGSGGDCAIHHAVRNQDEDMIRLLLEYEPSLDLRDCVGRTPAQYATTAEITMLLRRHKEKAVLAKGGAGGQKSKTVNATTVPPPAYSE